MIGLSNDQQNRLMTASSRLSKEQREMLTLAESQVIADRIDKVLHEIHTENQAAFITYASLTLGGVEFLAKTNMTKRRKFYNEPRKLSVYGYASHVVPFIREKF